MLILSKMRSQQPQAVFLDRDGTINVDMGDNPSVYRFEFIPGAIRALRNLSGAYYRLIVVTNQGGIGAGKYSKKTYEKITEHMIEELASEGVALNAIYHCPHVAADRCKCRKPEIGMLEQAVARFKISLPESWVIGDKTCDIVLGMRAGCKTILVETGSGGKDGKYDAYPDYTAKDLLEAAEIITNKRKRNCVDVPKWTNSPRFP